MLHRLCSSRAALPYLYLLVFLIVAVAKTTASISLRVIPTTAATTAFLTRPSSLSSFVRPSSHTSSCKNVGPVSSPIKSKRNNISMLVDAAFVGVGAVTGAVCRWQIGNIVTRKIAEQHPRFSHFNGWHTAGINILGSFVLGTLAGIPTVDPAASHDHRGITARTRLMAGVGFCGSFTTFSTFSVDVVGMLSKGEMMRAFSYVSLNNFGGIMAAFAGYNMAKRVIGR